MYKGTIPDPASVEDRLTVFTLDNHHQFPAGQMSRVCGNTFLMLNKTRFAEHFEYHNDFTNHFGIFQGFGKNVPFVSAAKGNAGACGTGACC
jgi:arsenite methyltransferase